MAEAETEQIRLKEAVAKRILKNYRFLQSKCFDSIYAFKTSSYNSTILEVQAA